MTYSELLRCHRKKKKPIKGLQALASGTLAIARFHTELDKTEKKLEDELEKENRKPKTKIERARRKGEKLIHSKGVLIVIVILNIIDCILVLGELILDMYYIKALMETTEHASNSFIADIKNQYPTDLYNMDFLDIEPLYDHILHSQIIWNNSFSFHKSVSGDRKEIVTNASDSSYYAHSLSKRSAGFHSTKTKTAGNITQFYYFDQTDGQALEEKLAHAFHKASITILCILALENLFKICIYGVSFLERKLEVFDCAVIYCSLFVDVYFLKGISAFKIQEFVIILAFLVPWRVIRVVNSLVVSVIEHEHFRLKLLYKQKKTVTNDAKKLKQDNKLLQQSIDVIKHMALENGISEQKINQHLALIQQKQKGKSKGSKEGIRPRSLFFNSHSGSPVFGNRWSSSTACSLNNEEAEELMNNNTDKDIGPTKDTDRENDVV